MINKQLQAISSRTALFLLFFIVSELRDLQYILLLSAFLSLIVGQLLPLYYFYVKKGIQAIMVRKAYSILWP